MRRPLAPLLLALLATTLFLGLAELAARTLGPELPPAPDPISSELIGDWRALRRWDPLLFWSLRPGAREGLVEINTHGVRGPEIRPREPGELRILSLGESTTYAGRLAYAATYSARIERALETRTGRPVRVINAGVPGYTIFQGWAYLAHRGLALEPDVVLLYFGFNDFLPVSFLWDRDALASEQSGGLTDRELFALRRRPLARLDGALRLRSAFYRWWALRLASGGPPDLAAADRVRDPRRPRVPEADRRELLARIQALCREHGVELVIVVPWYRRFVEHEQLLRDFSAEEEVRLVDLPQRLGSEAPRTETLFLDDVHPSAEGHALIAAEILRELAEDASAREGAPH